MRNIRLRMCTSILATVGMLFGAYAQADRYVLGGNPPGSLFNSIANAIGTVVSQNSENTIDVLPQGGTVYYPMMLSKEVDFGLVNPFDAYAAHTGMAPYGSKLTDKGFSLRTVMVGKPINISFITTKDSGIKNFADLKGKRVVADYGAFASSSLSANTLLATAGLTKDDIKVVTVGSYPQGVKAVQEGRADASVASIGSGVTRELDATRGAKILSVTNTPEALSAARKIGKSWVISAVKPGAPGVTEEVNAISYGVPVVARADLDDQAVRSLLETVWNHHEKLPGIFGWMRGWTPDKFVNTAVSIPYHPAAIAFYKEKGVWTSEMDRVQSSLK